MNLQDLRKEIPYKWRVQEAKENATLCVAYIDARDVMNALDSVVGAGNWQSKYESHNGNLYCSIGIKTDGEWVWKTDCGSESNVEKEKGEASDAFKRAAVQWGIGRFLYDLPKVRLKSGKTTQGKFMPVNSKGEIIWDKDVLTDYIINVHLKSKTNPAKSTEKAPDKAKKAELKDEQIEKLVERIKAGKGTIEELMKAMIVSKEQEEKIKELLKTT